MQYKYITKNNLENTQDYMYSQYLGHEFIEQYFQSRSNYVNEQSANVQTAIERMLGVCDSCSECFVSLENIYNRIVNPEKEIPLEQIRLFQKRFEVKKRLYSTYKTSMSVASSSEEYKDFNLYLMLSAILLETYRRTNSLTYFSTFLKINDTLLSCYSNMKMEQQCVLKTLISEEVACVKALLKKKLGSTRGGRDGFA